MTLILCLITDIFSNFAPESSIPIKIQDNAQHTYSHQKSADY